MRKDTSVKYPNSANLFRFCRKVLDHKYGGIRVIDQDVGQILSFDPADCSHWKKGKKNIKSIQAIKNIATHLGIDEKLVVDIASGEIDDNEAYYEFNEYNQFSVDPQVLETAKKNYYRQNAGSWSKEKEASFKNFFEIDIATIDKLVSEIHQKIQFEEAPLYLPEVFTAFEDITLKPEENYNWDENDAPIKAFHKDGKTEIIYKAATEMKPYMRFRIAQALGEHFLRTDRNITDLKEYENHMKKVENSLFASKLLAPANLIKKEMSKLNVSKDVISQLAETFWVAKTFINTRVKDILENDSNI